MHLATLTMLNPDVLFTTVEQILPEPWGRRAIYIFFVGQRYTGPPQKNWFASRKNRPDRHLWSLEFGIFLIQICFFFRFGRAGALGRRAKGHVSRDFFWYLGHVFGAFSV